MFKNFIKIAFRNLLKHKSYSLINISGLTIGMTCCILILLFVQNELTYDKHHENAERIYRVAVEADFGGNHFDMVVAAAPLAETVVKDYPEVEAATRFRTRGDHLVRKEGVHDTFKEEDVVYADGDIFKVFTIPVFEGNPERALSEPNTVAISRNIAAKYFEHDSPIGQTLLMDSKPHEVTAVFEDMPHNSHFHFDFLLAMPGLEESKNGMWLSNNFQTYLLLSKSADKTALEAKFPDMIRNYMGPQVEQYMGKSFDDAMGKDLSMRLYLQKLTDIHLRSDLIAEFEPNGNIHYVYIFTAIAFFILLIACINFMNLSTAKSAGRAKEVGIRKVVGSFRRQLVGQFLAESVMMSLLGLAFAIGLVELLLPVFNLVADKELVTNYIQNWPMLVIMFGIMLAVGIGAGSYPAFVLSSFQPVSVLKGEVSRGEKSGKLRSALVIFQFAASVILIIGTLVVLRQLSYIQNKSLGFSKEQVIILHDAYGLDNNLQAFKNEVLRHTQIKSATVSGYLPVSSNRSNTGFWPEGKSPGENAVSMQIWEVDEDYIKTMGMEIKQGRDFSREFGTDSSGVILNENALGLFGFKEPIGKRIYTWGRDAKTIEEFTIVGIVKNFHFESLKENITALGMHVGKSTGSISFKFEVGNVATLIGFLEKTWQEFGPGQPFAYSFMDDRFAEMYEAEQKIGHIFSLFAGLAIFTACLGLFGLASYTAEQRTKEIGIRKVLGASVPGIVVLFMKEFIRFVFFASVIAAPVAWYLMQKWLANFAFRIELGAEIFIMASLLALGIAIVTVSFQAVKAAVSNPVNSLKYE